MQMRISCLLMLGRRNEYSRHQVRNQETENGKQTFRMRMQASWLAFKSYKGTRLSIPEDLKDAISWLLGLQRTSFFFSLVFMTLDFIIMQTANSPTGSSWVTSPGNITFQSCTSRIQYKQELYNTYLGKVGIAQHLSRRFLDSIYAKSWFKEINLSVLYDDILVLSFLPFTKQNYDRAYYL